MGIQLNMLYNKMKLHIQMIEMAQLFRYSQQITSVTDILYNIHLYFQIQVMKKSILFYICLQSLFIACFTSNSNTHITTRTNTQQIYKTSSLPNEQIYAIEVERVGSSFQIQNSRCQSVPRSIDINHKRQFFQLTKGQNSNQSRQQKIYQKLTTLSQQENMIQEFQIIGNNLFAITTQGNGYFIPLDKKSEIQKIKTNFFDGKGGASNIDYVVLKNHKDRVLIISINNMVLCRPDSYACEKIEGYQKLNNFRGAQIYKDETNEYIFLITSQSIVYYEFTSNNKLRNKKQLNKQFFGVQTINLKQIYKLENNKILVLDGSFGLRQIQGINGLSNFNKEVKVIYEQFGCYELIGQNNGQSLALSCSPSVNSFVILKLIKSKQFTQHIYEPLETIFLHQKIYQIDYIENIVLSRMFSGVKLFWSSKTLGSPYPHFYRNAGNIFLHNAIQAKLKYINGIKSLIISAEDQIFIYEIKIVEPYVICSSSKSIIQDYKLKYYFPCPNQSQLNPENICDIEQSLTFEVWQHKQLKIISVLIPFILSLIGCIILVYFIYKKYEKYKYDIQSAKLKYNVEDDHQFDT